MDDRFLTADLPLEQSRRLPDPDWFTPDSTKKAQERSQIRSAATGNDALVIADTDADGLGCITIARAALGDSVGYAPAGPHGTKLELHEALREAADSLSPLTDVYVCDISPNNLTDTLISALDALLDAADTLVWCDHHNYTEELQQALTTHTTDFRLGDSEAVCATDVLFEHLTQTHNPDWPEHITDFVAVTRDRDCWILDDPRNQDIADYAEITDAETYINTALDHGANYPHPVQEEIETYRSEKTDLVDAAVAATDVHTFDTSRTDRVQADTLDIGMVYGRCPSSDTAEAIRTEHNVDAVCIIKPSGAVSLRGSDSFTHCGTIAGIFDGGGHDQAAGCFPPDVLFESMLDYAEHWHENGKQISEYVFLAFAVFLSPDESLDDLSFSD